MNFPRAPKSFLQKIGMAMAVTVVFAFTGTTALADPINLVKNGNFDVTTGAGQIDWNTTVSDWSTEGYNFVFAEGTGDTLGAVSWFNGPLTLWGASNGGANALAISSNGGNFVGADGSYGVSPIQQTIDGLVIGQHYIVSFEWAAAQQWGFGGTTTSQWIVNLGDDLDTRQATTVFHTAEHGSSDWMHEIMEFTATKTSEVLSFLAAGTPVGEPPFSLLDGVSMRAVPPDHIRAVPEPTTWLLLLAGLAVMAGLLRRARPTRAA